MSAGMLDIVGKHECDSLHFIIMTFFGSDVMLALVWVQKTHPQKFSSQKN
jgi:hypothetical protein